MSNLIVFKEVRANEYKYKAKWIVSHKLSGLKSRFFLFEISVRIINVVVSLCLPYHTPTEGCLLLGAIFYPNGKRVPWRLLFDKKTGRGYTGRNSVSRAASAKFRCFPSPTTSACSWTFSFIEERDRKALLTVSRTLGRPKKRLSARL